MAGVRWAVLRAAAALIVVGLGGSPALATTPIVPIAAASQAFPGPVGVCPGQEAPPPPPAPEELVSGAPPPAPLPVPREPVGGPRLGSCGDVLAPGASPPPEVSAAGWVVADLDTGAVLEAHDPHGRHRPASTLKILTALVVLERLDLDTVVVGTADDANVEGSRAGIGPGGQYTVRQLLAGLLLNSGNDTANALARSLGGIPTTLAAMSAEAARLGALDTRPATPSGLDGPGMSTSAYDLALLFRAALDRPEFARLIATPSVDFPGFGDKPGFQVYTDNQLLLHYPGAIGGKTGFTDAARHTFVGAALRDGRRLVVALVRGEQRPVPMWRQAAALLDHGFSLPASTSVGTLVAAAPERPVATQTTGNGPGAQAASGATGTGGGLTSAQLLAGFGTVVAVVTLAVVVIGRRRISR
ncbi:D-alanyl-D-alanine carboxypeptidase family protein [Pseudonocardia hispaniensis]|uniref:D-alanyl-D-alanine carboxypeptidase family protein n=1 Tax=Pseudonocardia hispaniensis TaxID=904933 RepID=A0ABW1IWA6_9PSEU